ncbi:MAG TPA: radical SAM protein, partial [Blastocatellia bacterium]|nr:radical SAM protein [Blastocatellia bacterium]
DEIKGLIDKLAESGSVTDVTLMGGEPTMRKDLEDVIGYCVQKGILTQIVSNGSPLTKSRIDSLLEAGNWGFTISIDGPTAESYGYTRPYRFFPHLLKHVRYLSDRIHEIRDAGGPTHNLSINTIVHRKNRHEAPQMIDLALDLRADSVSFMPITMPPDVEDQALTEWQRSYTLKLIPEADEYIETGIAIGRRIDPRHNPDLANLDVGLKFLSPVVRDYLAVEYDIHLPLVAADCAAVTRIGSLNHDGTMVICEAFDVHHEAVEVGAITARPMDLRQQSFLDIWNSEPYQQMFSWVYKQDIYNHMEPCYRCPHLYNICRPCPERAIALAATGSSERFTMQPCHEIVHKAGDLYELRKRAEEFLGTPSNLEIAHAVARAN